MPLSSVVPATTTDEATKAKTDAERITAPILFGGQAQDQQITTARLRSWLSFGPTADGGYGVSMDTADLEDVLTKVAKSVDRTPVNASFTTSGSRITGVTKSQTGYKLDLAATETAGPGPHRCTRGRGDDRIARAGHQGHAAAR